MSIIRVICEKMSTREPRLCSLGSSLSSSTILPAAGAGRLVVVVGGWGKRTWASGLIVW